MRQRSGSTTSGRVNNARIVRRLAAKPALGLIIAALPFLSPPTLGQDSRPPSSEFDSAARITGFELHRLDEGAELWVESTSTLELVGLEMNSPSQMVIQLPRHRPPSHLLEGVFEGGPFTQGSVTLRETDRGPLTKVNFSIQNGYKSNLSIEGNILRLQLRPANYRPAPAAQIDQLAAESVTLKQNLDDSERERQALTVTVANALAKNQTLESRFELLDQQRRILETGLSTALAEFSRLEQALRDREADVTSLQTTHAAGECAAANERIAQLQLALTDYASSRYGLANQLEEVETERDSLKTQLSRLIESRSFETALTAVDEPLDPPEQSVDQPTTQILASTARATNLRAAPNQSASPLALLASEIEVEVIDLSADWVQVSWESQVGWIPRADLQIVEN